MSNFDLLKVSKQVGGRFEIWMEAQGVMENPTHIDVIYLSIYWDICEPLLSDFLDAYLQGFFLKALQLLIWQDVTISQEAATDKLTLNS